MEFEKYPKIHNVSDKLLMRYQCSKIDTRDWVALEKIHGANMSFTLADGRIIPARRNAFIGDDRSFMTAGLCIDGVIEKIRNNRKLFGSDIVRLYGELCGGLYPEPSVLNFKDLSPVQREVYYSPIHHFVLFDVKVNDKFLPHDEVAEIGTLLNLHIAPIIAEGPLEELLEISPVFHTKFPETIGLPPIENNYAEGLVLKPRVPIFYKGGDRVIIKHKNPAFAEKKARKKRVPQPINLSEDATKVLNTLSKYVTEQRLNNILSHGDNYSNFGELQGAYMRDLLEEAFAEEGITPKQLDSKERKRVSKILFRSIADVIRPRVHEIFQQ